MADVRLDRQSKSQSPVPSAASVLSAPQPQLDFETLLSREYRPARVTQLIPREAYNPSKNDRKKKKGIASSVANTTSSNADATLDESSARKKRRDDERNSRLVLSLVSQTPAFEKHMLGDKDEEAALKHKQKTEQVSEALLAMRPPPPRKHIIDDVRTQPALHEIHLGDWESKINWEGSSGKVSNQSNTPDQVPSSSSSALALLKKPRNPYLDNLIFDANNVSWDGNTKDLLQRSLRAPLILELGVAGRSVARHVYQNTVLSAQRPTAAINSDAYQQRIERDWSKHGSVTSTADVAKKGALHADKDKMEALIEARQKKRAQMAKDKKTRIEESMGTMALGGGRGRTITSSLMGPGGTERTGRPSRQMGGSSASHDAEYVEQLDMVNNHSMVRDLSKVMLRQFHRPKLPMSVVRPDLGWQLQIRFSPQQSNSKGKPGTDSTSGSSSLSYHAMMTGTHAGAISKSKLRTEADLSPTEGNLVVLEYCEERPPIQLSKGMACKIVNYYRGDKARCPVSAGGGDRPARRKRAGDVATGAAKDGASQAGKTDRPQRLDGPKCETSNILDWVGRIPKKSQKDRSEKEAIDILPEGITEILHPKVHGPFLGEIEEGTTLTGLISNLFVAPMFRHEAEPTDFLMILTPPGGVARPGQRESMGVILREMPKSIFTVGQTEPRTRVNPPNSQGEKNFTGPWVSYQIAKAIARTEAREGHGLRFDEIKARVLPNLELADNALRQRLKQVALFDKNTQIWTTKRIEIDDYPGVDALGKTISPEGVAAFETTNAASRRLVDLGIQQLFAGAHTVASVGLTMNYLKGQQNSLKELFRKAKKRLEISRSNRSISSVQLAFYEKAAAKLESWYKALRQRQETAQFIYEELQLTPWHLTGEFIDVHKKGEGSGMMKLTGLGDPSGQGEGFSFLREADSKPSKSLNSNTLNAEMKKITGTEDDLRKLTMKQMAKILLHYGMAQKYIDTLKRWDRVHVIRDLSTKAASDGMGDGLERFARGEKMKLAEQKQMYRDRIQIIWKRQIASLSSDIGDKAIGGAGAESSAGATVGEETAGAQPAQPKKTIDADKEDSDDDSDDDDFAATFEEEMMDQTEANQILAAHTGGEGRQGGLGQLRAAVQDQDLTKDARELAALKRQREEERAAQEGFQAQRPNDRALLAAQLGGNRKVIRKRISKTHPNGEQTTTFKFILHPDEVGKIMDRLQHKPVDENGQLKEIKYEYGIDEKPPGQAMFEDEDDYEYSSKGRGGAGRRRGVNRKRGGRGTPRVRANLQIGKLKQKISKEERIRKRKREEEELEVYATSAKRKGTSNRRERGSIRDRRPHVIFAEKLEEIRSAVESRQFSGPFHKPVPRRLVPKYYEVISHPIDLQTIRDKISRYEYRTADSFTRDIELMKNNAVKFNGPASPISLEAIAILDYVRDQVQSQRDELTALETAVDELMNAKPKSKKKSGASKKKESSSALSNVASVGGVAVNLGDLSKSMHFDGADSDSDDSFGANLLDL